MTTIPKEILDHMLTVSRQISRSNRLDDGAFLGRIYFESRSTNVPEHAEPSRRQALRQISFRQAALRQLDEDNKLKRLPIESRCNQLRAESAHRVGHVDRLSYELDVRQAVGELDADLQQIAIALMGNETLQEIATDFGMSRQAIHKKWKLAKLLLREYLHGYENEN